MAVQFLLLESFNELLITWTHSSLDLVSLSFTPTIKPIKHLRQQRDGRSQACLGWCIRLTFPNNKKKKKKKNMRQWMQMLSLCTMASSWRVRAENRAGLGARNNLGTHKFDKKLPHCIAKYVSGEQWRPLNETPRQWQWCSGRARMLNHRLLMANGLALESWISLT